MSTRANRVRKGARAPSGVSPGTAGASAPTDPEAPPAKRARRVTKKDDSASSSIEDSGTESDELDLTRARAHARAETSDTDSNASDQSQININFEFVDPQPIHYKSVRRLLEHYLPGAEAIFDVSGMADAIVAQKVVGTMVQVEDDLDVYAFATILPLSQHKDAKWLTQIRTYLTDKARTKGLEKGRHGGDLNALFTGNGAPRVGLLVSERVVNMPPELAPSIYASLVEDLSWAHLSEAHKEPFTFDILVNLSPCFAESHKAASHADDYFYYRFEEEFFHAQASKSLWFADSAIGAGEAVPKAVVKKGENTSSSVLEDETSLRPPQGRRLIVFPASAMQPCLEAMQHAVSLAAGAPTGCTKS